MKTKILIVAALILFSSISHAEEPKKHLSGPASSSCPIKSRIVGTPLNFVPTENSTNNYDLGTFEQGKTYDMNLSNKFCVTGGKGWWVKIAFNIDDTNPNFGIDLVSYNLIDENNKGFTSGDIAPTQLYSPGIVSQLTTADGKAWITLTVRRAHAAALAEFTSTHHTISWLTSVVYN